MTLETLDVVFVCTGNRARSALGAELLRLHGPPSGLVVRSAGIMDLGSGVPALPEFVDTGRSFGVDLSSHVAHGLTRGELRDADLVIGFERQHVVDAVAVGHADPGRTFLLGELVELLESGATTAAEDGMAEALAHADARRTRTRPDASTAIADPIGRPRAEMDRAAAHIDVLVRRLAYSLFPEQSGSLG